MVKTATVLNVFWTKVKVKDPQENERTLVHRHSEVVIQFCFYGNLYEMTPLFCEHNCIIQLRRTSLNIKQQTVTPAFQDVIQLLTLCDETFILSFL